MMVHRHQSAAPCVLLSQMLKFDMDRNPASGIPTVASGGRARAPGGACIGNCDTSFSLPIFFRDTLAVVYLFSQFIFSKISSFIGEFSMLL